jgi:hypothetical protein
MTPFSKTALRSVREIFHTAASADLRRSLVELVSSEKHYFGAAFMLWLVGVVELIQKIGGQRLDPRFWMGIAVLITVYGGVRVFRLTRCSARSAAAKPGTAAEQLVRRMQSNGVAVYPAPASSDGAGYVIVGSTGVYAMAVKAGKVFGSRTIRFGNRNKLVMGGRIADSRALRQANTLAEKLGEQLRGVRRIPIKPLVVFLNDWRVDRSSTEADVAVMNANQVESYLNSQQAVLSASEVSAIDGLFADPVTA